MSDSTNSMALLSSADIPQAVAASGPQYQVFPNEVLMEIFKYMLIYTRGSVVGHVVDARLMGILNVYGPLFRLRMVSKSFNNLALRVFYEVNVFSFAPVIRAVATWDARFPAALPPVCFRECLRRIQVTVFIQDFHSSIAPGDHMASTYTRVGADYLIEAARQLIMYSRGARQLFELTSGPRAITNLHVLGVHVVVDLQRGNGQGLLAAFAAAGFSLAARTVKVTVTDRLLRLLPGQARQLEEILQ